MSAAAPESLAPPPAIRQDHGHRALLLAWVVALIPLVLFLNGLPVQRTQEARVVETARQMLGRGLSGWLIPVLNGEVRVRKPPLAYWMAAGSFSTFGVSDFTARLPTFIVSWLTLAATFMIAHRLFGRRAAVVSSACLLGSYLFFRQGRLAETDAPAALLATIAVDLFWRAFDSDGFALFHLAAIATGLSLFAKQGPGWFAPLFFVSYALVRRRPRALWRFILSGAPLTLIAVAGWWYGYAAAVEGLAQFKRELAEVTEGLDHPAPFYVYFHMTLLASAPWSILVIGALVAAAKRARKDARLSGMLVWSAACFVPLCFVGNKQEHYLLPLMPPLMILVGWLVSEAVRADGDLQLTRAVVTLGRVTIIGTLVASVALPIGTFLYRGTVMPLDFILAAVIFVVAALGWLAFNRHGLLNGLLTLAAGWSVAFAALLGLWGPTLAPSDIRQTAAQIRGQFGAGPYVFYGGDTSLPLCFALREEIPRIDDHRPDLLIQAARLHPTLAVIWEIPQRGTGPELPPPQFRQVGEDIGAKGQNFRIYRKFLSRSD